MGRYFTKFWVCASVASAAIFLFSSTNTIVRWLDINILNESIKDSIGWGFSDEDWSSIPIQPIDFDKTWVDSSARPFRIAHALGGSGKPNANTFSAFEQSRKNGYALFEVDISLTLDNKLLCVHDLNSMTSTYQLNTGGCEFDQLLRQVDGESIWFILDIKTNFDTTAARILEVARNKGLTNTLIFQLYKPTDFSWIQKASRNNRLPFPIVTTYMSRRSSNHILRHTHRLGLNIVTVPFIKLRSIAYKPPNMILMTHPVHTCEAFLSLNEFIEVGGYYTIDNLELCGTQTSHPG